MKSHTHCKTSNQISHCLHWTSASWTKLYRMENKRVLGYVNERNYQSKSFKTKAVWMGYHYVFRLQKNEAMLFCVIYQTLTALPKWDLYRLLRRELFVNSIVSSILPLTLIVEAGSNKQKLSKKSWQRSPSIIYTTDFIGSFRFQLKWFAPHIFLCMIDVMRNKKVWSKSY